MSASQDRLNAKKRRINTQEDEKYNTPKTTAKLRLPTLTKTSAATQKTTTQKTGAKLQTPTLTKTTTTTPKTTAKLQMPTLTKTTAATTAATPKTTKYTPAGTGIKINALGAGDYSGGGKLLEKAAKTVSGAVKGTGSAYANIAGSAVEGMGNLQENMQKGEYDKKLKQMEEYANFYKKSLATGRNANTGAPLTAQQKAQYQKILDTQYSDAKIAQMRELYGDTTAAQKQRTMETANAAFGASDRLKAAADADVAAAKEGSGKVGQFLVDLGYTGTQMLGDAAANVIAPGAGMVSMATRVYGDASGEARREGKSAGQQALSGLKGATIELLTEKLFGGLAKAYGKGTADEVVARIADKLTKTDRGKAAATWLINSGGEGVEEVLSDVLNPLADRVLGLDNGEGSIFKAEDLAQMGYDFLLGTAMGAIGGAGQLKAPQLSEKGTAQPAQQKLQMPQLAKTETAQRTAPKLQMPTLGSMGLAQNEYSTRLSAAEPQKAATLDELGRRLGMRIELVDSVLGGQANGQYLSGRNTMQIAADAVNPVEYVAAHEATHYLQEQAPAEYGAYRDAAADYYRALYGEDGLNYMVEGYKQAAQEAGVQLDDTGAMDEIAADFTEKLMDDTDLFARFAADNRTAAQKLLDALKAFIAKVRATLTGGARDTAARNAYGTDFSTLEDIAQKWQNAFDAAAERVKNAETATVEGGGARYMIKQAENGAKYVQADRQVIFGNDPAAWSEQLENYINGKIRRGEDVQLIAEDGDVLTLTAKSAGKLSSPYDNNGRTMSEDAFERKVNAASHIDELAQVSRRVGRTKPDEGGRHGEMARDGWNYREAFFRDFDGTYYRVKISVAQGADGNAVYNIGQMKKEAFPKIKGSYAVSGNDPRGNTSQESATSVNTNVSTAVSTIPANGKDVKGKFSLKSYSDAEKQLHSDEAKKYFGKTYKWSETGYITTDGSRLDFSGRHDGAPGGYRTVDHRDIIDALGDDYGGNEYSDGMVQFMTEGNIRISPESGGIDLSVMPTTAQMAALSQFVEHNHGEVILDIDTLDGNTISSTEYPRGTRARKVTEDIRRYFEAGETPYVSDVSRFRYQIKAARDVEQELRDLKRERTILKSRNKTLEEQVAKWRGEVRKTKTPVAVEKDVKRLGLDTIRRYNSDAKYSDIQEDLTALANAVMQKDVTMSDLMPHAKAAAETIVNNTTELTEYGAELLEIKDYLKHQKIKFDGDMNDYSNFRREHLGTLKLSKAEGLPVDTVYDELTERFGEDYFPSGLYTEADKLQRIAEALDNTEFVYENPYDAYHDDVVQEVAYELIEGAFDRVRQRITYADRRAEETRAAREEAERAVEELNKEREERKWQEKRANSLMSQAHSLYEEVQRLRGGPQKERAKPTMPQLSRQTGFAREAPQITSEPVSVPVTREQARQRMAEEAAARAAAEEQRKAVPETMQRVGVAPFGSEADYAGAEALAKNAGTNERARRRMKREMEKLPATEKERMFARQVYNGQIAMEDVPNTVNRATVAKLTDYYATMDSTAETELLRQKRNIILEREAEKMEPLLGPDVEYDEGGLRESGKRSGKIARQFSTLRRNLQTPARICATEWGAEHGEKVYKTLFWPVTENNGRQVEWVSSMIDRVRTFKDSAGKERPLNRAERAIVQRLVETSAAEERVANFSRQYAPAAESVKNGTDAADAAQEFGIKKGTAEYEDLLNYAANLAARAEAEAQENVDATAVDAAVEAYGKLYGELYEAINTFLAAHGYKPIGFIEGYAPHMQPEETKTAFSKAMKLLGLDDTAMMLPTSISGQTADLKPYKQYDPFFQTRQGNKTEYDIAQGFENYIYYLGNIFYHTDDIMRIRSAANYMRKTYSSDEAGEMISWAEGARNFSDEQIEDFLRDYGIIGKGTKLSGEDARAKLNEYIDKLYEQIGDVSRYSEMVKYLDNYANRLAGKQNMVDRGAEAATGRGSLNWINALTGKFGGAKLAFNISSALNQTGQLPVVMAENGEANTVKAVRDFFGSKEDRDSFIKSSNYLKGKRGVNWLVQDETAWEKVKNTGFAMTEAVDGFTAYVAVRSKYLKELNAGKSKSEAMRAADEYGRNVMGSRARGEKPMLFDTKNPFWQIVTRFQLEAMNSWEHISRDVPKEIRSIAKAQGKTKAAQALAARAGRYVVYAFLANLGVGALSGGSPVPFDVVGNLLDAYGAAMGVTKTAALKTILDNALQQVFDERLFGTDEPDDDDEADLWAAFESLFGNVANDVPIVGRVAALAGIGDQTLPVADLSKVGDFASTVKDKGLFSADALDKGLTAGSEFVFGGNQLRKTVQGSLAVARGGVYGSNGRLRYEVGQTPWNAAQGFLFGKSALKESQEYYAGSDSSSRFSAEGTRLKEAKDAGDETAEVVSRWWNKQQSKITELYKEIGDTGAEGAEKRTIEEEAVAIRENALDTEAAYKAAAEKYLQRGMDVDEAYREANRECFGAEYALEAYNTDVYQRAKNVVQNRNVWNVSYEDFYEYYFATKDMEKMGDASATAQKLNWLYNSDLDETTQAELWLADMASDSAIQKQKELENSAGITLEQYYAYKLLSANDTKKTQKLEAINALGLTTEQKNAIYFSEGWAESKLYEAPWYTGRGSTGAPTITKKKGVPTIVRKQTAPVIARKGETQNAPTIVRKTEARKTVPIIVRVR